MLNKQYITIKLNTGVCENIKIGPSVPLPLREYPNADSGSLKIDSVGATEKEAIVKKKPLKKRTKKVR